MNPAELRAAAQRVLLARCCEHPAFVDACECAEQVAADVDALIRAGLLRCPVSEEPTPGPDHEEVDP